MPAVPPNPKLGKSQALNVGQANTARLNGLIPYVATELSPVTVYQPGAVGGVGNELLVTPGQHFTSSSFGVWVAPDLNGDGSVWYATVECFGGGGGGGGGNSVLAGGGGGGGEYAREDQYPIEPGKSYVYLVGTGGSGGVNNILGLPGFGTEGSSGSVTVFDVAGEGFSGGVMANGGLGGDATSVGIGGTGGTGSSNTTVFAGGSGGTNTSSSGSDNPLTLAQTNGMFVGNTLKTSIIPTWYIMNDSNSGSATRNDATLNGNTGTWQNVTGSFQSTSTADAPAQVPAYTSLPFGNYGPNQTQQSWASQFVPVTYTAPGSRFQGNVPNFTGNKLTVSCWVQAPSGGAWSNPASGSKGIIATNSLNPHTNSLKGYALYMLNVGTPSAPNWQCHAEVGDGTHALTQVSATTPATPGTWYYIVMTYNAGTLNIYLNGVLQQTANSSGYTSVPSAQYNTKLGMDPASNINSFFGLISNIWWATDCATSTLITQAFGSGAGATGGAGGGASGGPSATGGNGSGGVVTVGGAGGAGAVQPASFVGYTTAAQSGYAGSNAHASNLSPATPAGGPCGAGGGGCGTMVSPPALTTLTYQFTSAATYTGTDASSAPDSPYNPNQQSHPSSGVNTLLYAGGLAGDPGSGSKNSILLLPKSVKADVGNAGYTITNVFLTFTNAFPANTVESVLEIGYSNDTALPQTYDGTSLAGYVGAAPVPIGAGTITYDLTQSVLPAHLANGTATAIVLGPGAAPSFDAYNAQTGQEFYSSIYGPGAYDTTGNALYPTLQVVLQKTLTTQVGSGGNGGGILLTAVSSRQTPVAHAQPFAGSDSGGNQYAQGFTGPITAWDPTISTPGSFKPEAWKNMSLINNWTQQGASVKCQYRMLPTGDLEICGVLNTNGGTVTSRVFAALPSAYWPITTLHFFPVFCVNVNTLNIYGTYDTAGNLSIAGDAVSSSYEIVFTGVIPLT